MNFQTGQTLVCMHPVSIFQSGDRVIIKAQLNSRLFLTRADQPEDGHTWMNIGEVERNFVLG